MIINSLAHTQFSVELKYHVGVIVNVKWFSTSIFLFHWHRLIRTWSRPFPRMLDVAKRTCCNSDINLLINICTYMARLCMYLRTHTHSLLLYSFLFYCRCRICNELKRLPFRIDRFSTISPPIRRCIPEQTNKWLETTGIHSNNTSKHFHLQIQFAFLFARTNHTLFRCIFIQHFRIVAPFRIYRMNWMWWSES